MVPEEKGDIDLAEVDGDEEDYDENCNDDDDNDDLDDNLDDDLDDDRQRDPDWKKTPLFEPHPGFRSTARRKTDLFKQKKKVGGTGQCCFFILGVFAYVLI